MAYIAVETTNGGGIRRETSRLRQCRNDARGRRERRFDARHTGTIWSGAGCCCAGPLDTALKQVTWIKSATVKPNSPVMLTIDETKTVNLSDLISTMMKAGYSPTSMVVSG